MTTKTLVDIATIVSPVITLTLTGLGWFVIFSDSRKSSARAETYDMLNSMIKIVLALNQRSAERFLEEKHTPGSHRAWVASVSVDISSLRAIATILKDVHSIEIPYEFFYTVRRNYTLDAEKFSTYTFAQSIKKIAAQNTEATKSLKLVYELYPGKK
ncbi:hypothetical protein [Stutzerimonas stutzeri]|uniref:hypothetical protein n=1 Tax=Stutzerimonas stutzeri TaxID=316 RepID=UPI001C4404FD|nr:hypothetical protein [Stutzerimonas stutzeri]